MAKKDEEKEITKEKASKAKPAAKKAPVKKAAAKETSTVKAETKKPAAKKAVKAVKAETTAKAKATEKKEPTVKKEAKEVQAVAKYLTSSPFKLRQIANLVRGKKVEQALIILQFMPKEAARTLFKVVSSAASNAERNEHLMRSSLYIHRLEVDEGPTLKRFRPRAQGRYGPILKRGSHIKVILKEAEGR